MAALPAWALAIVICTAVLAGLSMLSILARTARHEVELHSFKIRVTKLRAEYERTLKILRGEVEEGEFDIIEDEEEDTAAGAVEADVIEAVEVAEVVGASDVETAEPGRAAA